MTNRKRKNKKTVVIGILGTSLDQGKAQKRWQKWRPSVSICQQEDFVVDRFELLVGNDSSDLFETIKSDIKQVSPETDVKSNNLSMSDPWDFEEVYSTLYDFARKYKFDTEKENYYLSITTGTHVAQICMFLLAESRHIPSSLLQSSPRLADGTQDPTGSTQVIDLNLSRYDKIAMRQGEETTQDLSFLKAGIATKNKVFNELVAQIEQVAISSPEPILLMGPTGAGKTQLARRIYDLKHQKRQALGKLVEVNCATLRGDNAMSTLFGHVRGAFTGAQTSRDGLLVTGDKGVVFLDEIGELGLDEQAMLLRAIEQKTFLPLGSDREVRSDFQLIAGTNKDLVKEVERGRFREDLLARINLWTYRLPGLRDRREDIEPNLDYELDRFSGDSGSRVRFETRARRSFLRFAKTAAWRGNFRDLNAAVKRMATLAPNGEIDDRTVNQEIKRLESSWGDSDAGSELSEFLSAKQIAEIDRFDLVQLREVITVCKKSKSMSAAGRELFQASREKRRSVNDADRLKKYLTKFGISTSALFGE